MVGVELAPEWLLLPAQQWRLVQVVVGVELAPEWLLLPAQQWRLVQVVVGVELAPEWLLLLAQQWWRPVQVWWMVLAESELAGCSMELLWRLVVMWWWVQGGWPVVAEGVGLHTLSSRDLPETMGGGCGSRCTFLCDTALR